MKGEIKKGILFLFVVIVLFSFASAAENFANSREDLSEVKSSEEYKFQNQSGSDLMIVGGSNVRDGKFYKSKTNIITSLSPQYPFGHAGLPFSQNSFLKRDNFLGEVNE